MGRLVSKNAGVIDIMTKTHIRFASAFAVLLCSALPTMAAEPIKPIRSAGNGSWSATATWEGGKVPAVGANVQIRTGHTVLYDVQSDAALRVVHVAGTLRFASDRDTRLDVCVLKIQAGDDFSEDGFECDAHLPAIDADKPRATLEVGRADRPIDAKHTALIRLVFAAGMDKDSCPAVVCCGGRMDFHGAPLNRAWVKLGANAKAEAREVTLAEAVTGWKVGDRVIVTATTRQTKLAMPKKTFTPSLRGNGQTEERRIRAIDGTKLTLDQPLTYDHRGDGDMRGEVANLSRNVVVESADPDKARGHTMYHRDSAGSISYAEFRHLGKEGVLGRYSLHYHLVGDTMRGSSVVGASIWDSGNRWLTIHGTNYLIVRDCVGYQSMGHGFFMEDGTEIDNVFDRNLAVQAFITKPLPKQVLPYDKNDGSGFWWANSANTFTRNVAAECDEYGYFFQATKTVDFDPVLKIRQPDGTRKAVDIRTLPFVRFDGNEVHCQRRHAFNLGGGAPFGTPHVDGVGPDERHPFVIRDFKAWDVHWAFHPMSPSVLVDGMSIRDSDYDIWRAVFKGHAYRQLRFEGVPERNQYFAAQGVRPMEDAYPKPLDPIDDRPPTTVITHLERLSDGRLRVRGSTADNGTVKRVVVNGNEAKALTANFAEWEVVLEKTAKVTAHAEDAAGNVEKLGHSVTVAP